MNSNDFYQLVESIMEESKNKKENNEMPNSIQLIPCDYHPSLKKIKYIDNNGYTYYSQPVVEHGDNSLATSIWTPFGREAIFASSLHELFENFVDVIDEVYGDEDDEYEDAYGYEEEMDILLEDIEYLKRKANELDSEKQELYNEISILSEELRKAEVREDSWESYVKELKEQYEKYNGYLLEEYRLMTEDRNNWYQRYKALEAMIDPSPV